MFNPSCNPTLPRSPSLPRLATTLDRPPARAPAHANQQNTRRRANGTRSRRRPRTSTARRLTLSLPGSSSSLFLPSREARRGMDELGDLAPCALSATDRGRARRAPRLWARRVGRDAAPSTTTLPPHPSLMNELMLAVRWGVPSHQASVSFLVWSSGSFADGLDGSDEAELTLGHLGGFTEVVSLVWRSLLGWPSTPTLPSPSSRPASRATRSRT